ncbi:MAG: PQQ-dependent sugar dehydrogenase [Sandaracinaceae bacterium]|nr:PQQ-dependent sugar dehydrogenase [Sandaracinaceae bacterium]
MLFGKILRLDVDNVGGGYAADGNPFGPATSPSGLPQIWAYGLRNPWRFSFDRTTGDLWIGDVGQGDWEEIDFQPASSTGGENYGWAAYEGTSVFRSSLLGNATNHTPPVLEYDHAGAEGVIHGYAVTGGYVYRGSAVPALRGWYLFGDYIGLGGGTPVAALRYCDGGVASAQQVPGLSGVLDELTSFGEDNAGELYMLGDRVVRIVAP